MYMAVLVGLEFLVRVPVETPLTGKIKMKWLVSGLLSAALFTAPALAGPREDADRIAELMYGPDVIQELVNATASLLAPSLIQELRKGDIDISDAAADAYVTMFLPEFTLRFEDSLRAIYADFYLEALTEAQLAEYRAFLETPTGQVVSSLQDDIIAEGSVAAEALGARIATATMAAVEVRMYDEKWPEGTSDATKAELSSIFLTAN